MAKDGNLLNRNRPRLGSGLVSLEQDKTIKKEKIIFSFFHFRDDIKHFGIGNCSQEWSVALIKRLSRLEHMTQQEVLEENRGSNSLRFHPINWDAKNVPIRREHLNWLPEHILSNEGEFPMMQFSISTGTGRIVGFFGKDSSVFHIVLLDPNHNIQPAKKHNYSIQPTTRGISQYDSLLSKLDNIKNIVKTCTDKNCKLHNRIDEIEGVHDNIVYITLDDDFYTEYDEMIKEKTLKEIFEAGILYLTDNN